MADKKKDTKPKEKSITQKYAEKAKKKGGKPTPKDLPPRARSLAEKLEARHKKMKDI